MIRSHTDREECGAEVVRNPDRCDTINLQTTSPKSKLYGIEIIWPVRFAS